MQMKIKREIRVVFLALMIVILACPGGFAETNVGETNAAETNAVETKAAEKNRRLKRAWLKQRRV